MYPLTAGPTVPPSQPIPTPLQFGVPGAMELVVILLIAVVLFGIPLVAFVGLFAYLRGIDRKVDRIESRLEGAGADATEASSAAVEGTDADRTVDVGADADRTDDGGTVADRNDDEGDDHGAQ